MLRSGNLADFFASAKDTAKEIDDGKAVTTINKRFVLSNTRFAVSITKIPKLSLEMPITLHESLPSLNSR